MTEDQALYRMSRGSILILTHTDDGDKWSVVPGGFVLPVTAAKLLRHSEVAPANDSLLPGEAAQTWRMTNAR